MSDNIIIPRSELPTGDKVTDFLAMHETMDGPISAQHFYETALFYLALAVHVKEDQR